MIKNKRTEKRAVIIATAIVNTFFGALLTKFGARKMVAAEGAEGSAQRGESLRRKNSEE